MNYKKTAPFYDLYANAEYDLNFWDLIARSARGPVLELMCGTGRIVHHLRSLGYPVDGLDLNREMLDVCEQKCITLPENPEIIHADARDFSFGSRFNLIFIGLQSISEVIDNEDKISVFESVRRHLNPEGRFWVTIHNPALRMQLFDGSEYDLGEFELEKKGETLTVSGRYDADPATGIVTGSQTFCIEKEDSTETIEMPVKFHLIEPEELEDLLEEAGFEILTRYGDYDCTDYNPDGSTFLLLECAEKY